MNLRASNELSLRIETGRSHCVEMAFSRISPSLATAPIVSAEETVSYWISQNALARQMEEQGYSQVEVTAVDGRWEGSAVKDGNIIQFHADPHTGTEDCARAQAC